MATHIVAIGGGGFSEGSAKLEQEEYLLRLANVSCPRVCFIGTASGDAESYLFKFYAAFSQLNCQPTHLNLFKHDGRDLRAHLLSSDVIFVGGGNTANMMAVWKVHQVDRYLQEAAQAEKVLSGISAGGICWFEAGITDSFGPQYAFWQEGLGLIDGLFCPHFDSEGARPAALQKTLQANAIDAYAAGEGVALHFVDGKYSHALGQADGIALKFARSGDSHERIELEITPFGEAS